MILPIVAYGDAVLRKKATTINADYPNLSEFIDNMYETMYGAYGVGLAAPQEIPNISAISTCLYPSMAYNKNTRI